MDRPAPGVPDDHRCVGAWISDDAEIVRHEAGGPDWFRLVVRCREIAWRALPGQFAQVRVWPRHDGAGALWDPFLPRPLSFCTLDAQRGTISFLYRVAGRGTALLSRARIGDRLSLLGPLGRSFPQPRFHPGRPLFLVGGGLGIPPLACAAAWARAEGRRPAALLGARTASGLAGAEEVAEACDSVTLATDDGSLGHPGPVTELLADALTAGAEVWACGPPGLLEAVERLSALAGGEAWLCVERPMACGFGVCLGCAVTRRDGAGYLRACVDGPVFRAGTIDVRS